MAEVGVKNLKLVPSPFIEDKFEQRLATKGVQAETAFSHLMKTLHPSRLCHGDVLTTTTFLAWRVRFSSLNEDRGLHATPLNVLQFSPR